MMMKMLMHGMIIMLIDGDNWLICVNGFELRWPAGCSQGLIAPIVLVISQPGCIIMIVAMYIYDGLAPKYDDFDDFARDEFDGLAVRNMMILRYTRNMMVLHI